MVRTEQPPGHDVTEIRHCHTLRTTIGELKKAASTPQDRKRAGCRRSECHASGGLEVSSMSWTSTITDIRSSAIFTTPLNRPTFGRRLRRRLGRRAGPFGPAAHGCGIPTPFFAEELSQPRSPAWDFRRNAHSGFGTYSSVEGDIDSVTVLTSEEEGTTVTKESPTLR